MAIWRSPPARGTGRHPLPEIEALTATFGRLGIDEQVQVIAYDQGAGMFAARLWWLLRWLGHEQVAVLNGGFAAWERAGLPVTRRQDAARGARFQCARRSGAAGEQRSGRRLSRAGGVRAR